MIKIEREYKQESFFHPKTNECWNTYILSNYKIILFWIIPIYIKKRDEKFNYDLTNKNNLGFNKNN